MLRAEIERIAREAAKTICDDNAAMLPTQFRTAIQHNTGVTASHIYRAIVSALRSDVVGYREMLKTKTQGTTDCPYCEGKGIISAGGNVIGSRICESCNGNRTMKSFEAMFAEQKLKELESEL